MIPHENLEELEALMDRARERKAPRAYQEQLQARHDRATGKAQSMVGRGPRATANRRANIARVNKDEMPRRTRAVLERKLKVEEVKRQRLEKARADFVALVESGTAYRTLTLASEYMHSKGFLVLRRNANKGDMQAMRLMMEFVKIVAQVELARAAMREDKGDSDSTVEVTTDWPSEASKA